MTRFYDLFDQLKELKRLAELAELYEQMEETEGAEKEEEENEEDYYGSSLAGTSRTPILSDEELRLRADQRRNRGTPFMPHLGGRRPPPEPKQLDRIQFRNEFFFSPEDFDELLSKLEPSISRQDTQFRLSIPARLRLQATIKYLMGAMSFQALEDDFGIPKSTLSRLIPSVCEAIWQVLYLDYIVLPQSEEEWIVKAEGFKEVCQYPSAIGILDGKVIKGNAYSKGNFNIVLFSLIDASHQFMFIEVGDQCPEDDSTVWQESTLKRALEEGSLNLPPKTGPVAQHFVSHDNYPLSERLMKPYTRQGPLQVIEKIFNYRFARASRVSQNTYQALASRFKVLRNPIGQKYDNAVKTIKAVVVLHNYILQNCNKDGTYLSMEDLTREDQDGNLIVGSFSDDSDLNNLASLGNQVGHRFTTKSAMDHRDHVAKSLVNDKLAPEQFKFAVQRNEAPTVQFILIQ